jgi:hypothetical protein
MDNPKTLTATEIEARLKEYHRLQTQVWQVYFNLLGMWGWR